MLRGLFGKQKTLNPAEIETLLKMVVVDRETAFITTSTFKFVSDVLDYDKRIFQLKNTLTRDEVLYQLRGKDLEVYFPYELTLYKGATSLVGLGMTRGMQTLKFQVPETMVQDEHRAAYRVSNFPAKPTVTFTTNSYDILKGTLMDISMTGAGVRLDPRWTMTNANLKKGLVILVDIRLSEELRLSTSAEIRYIANTKMGLKFQEIPKNARELLYKFIVKQRRVEYRNLAESQRKVMALNRPDSSQPETKALNIEKPTGKPTALVSGDNSEYFEALNSALNRKFHVLQCSSSVTDLRNHLELKPNLLLLEVASKSLEYLSQLKKLSSLTPSGCVLMFYGRDLGEEVGERLRDLGPPEDMIVDLKQLKMLMLFKKIQHYYEKKAPI